MPSIIGGSVIQLSCPNCYTQTITSMTHFPPTPLPPGQRSLGTSEQNQVSGDRSVGVASEHHNNFVRSLSSSLRAFPHVSYKVPLVFDTCSVS